MQRETSRSRSAEFQQREKRQSVMFTPESNAFATIPGTSRSSHSSVVSAGSQRLQGMRHPSMLEASRHRLSIRKSAAFPMQQTAPKPFLSSCADITRHGRDWNSEFQLAWEMEDNTISQAETRMEQLRRIEKEFVAEATRTVKQIVMLDDDGPRELPKFLQCYRVDNIFFRVLPDSRSGRNYVASLRGVLQSRTRLLTVPLSCMFFFRGMPVLAQALVPMPRDPTRLYGADSTNNQEVEAEILNMAEALNIPFPDGTLEVYEGLDGRFYLTNSNSTLTPLFVDDTIMKRQEMLRVCSHVTDGHEDTLAVLDKYEVLDAVVKSCMDSETLPIVDCLKNVCEYLHGFGVNMCLLKQVIHKIVQSGSYDSVAVNKVKELLFVEMLARSVKQEFYLEVQGKRVAYDDEVLSATLSKHMAETFTSVDVFQSRFLEVVAKKYGVVDEDNDIIQGLTSVRLSRKSDIVTRICTLLGVRIEKSSSNKTTMKWHVSVNARVLPQLIDPQQVRILAETYRTIMTQDGHRYAYCLPIRWKLACWDGEYDEALDLVHATAMAQKERYEADEIVPLYSRRSVCEVCFATMQKNCIEEGRSLFPGVMKGFEELTCPMTQGKRHIEYGFSLLRVALVYQQDDLVTYRSCVEEAVHHFYRSIEKLPYLKSEHSSWLHLQPYKGLLQCKRLLPSCSVNTNELVERSIELSTIGWASDFFMLYLWDLSLQLETEGRYTDAIRVLLTAITVRKKKPTVSMDLPTLLMDAAHIYRSWDQGKYSEHCATLMREAADKASELFGPTSREYAVVLNNKGAVEIELNRLKDAQETLTKAGMVFKEAKVPEDDPDYKAYLENLLYLEQRLAARPMVRRGFLRRYPFLAARSEDFVFSDLCPLEDDVFVTLAHERARMAGGTPDAKKLERQMKERLRELLRFIQDGDILKRYPFLPAVIHNVPTASLRLDDDALFEEFARQLQDSKDVAERKELEFRTREYVVKKAGDTALQRTYMDRREEAFNEAHEGYVNLMHPIPWLCVLEDERFNTLCDQLQKHINTQGQTLRTEGIQEKMAQRVAEIENETFHRRRELVTWLSPSKVYSVPIKDLMGDMDLLDLLRIRQAPSSCDNVTVDTIDILIRNKLEAVWKRAYIPRSCLDVDDEELYREFPFLVEMPHHQRLSTLMLYEDPTVSSLAARLQKRDADSRLQTEMTGAVKAIAARRRDAKELKKWYYDIDSFLSGTISLVSVPKVRDEYYVRLWQKRNIVQAQEEDNSPLMVTIMHQMEHQIKQMNSWMRKATANGFRRRLRLEAKYPFVTRRHHGYTLEMLDIEDDEEFMSIVQERQKLIAGSNASLGDIERLGHQANKRVAKIASNRVKLSEHLSQQYPFIPSRLEGVETLTICLEEHGTFAETAAYYRQLCESGSSENEVRCRRLVREMENIALAIAREIGVRKWRESIESEDLHERYPFLPEEPARGILLGDVRPVQQPAFRELSNTLDELRRDSSRNAEAIRATQEQMTALVVRLAEERVEATEKAHKEFPFLPRRVLGVRLGDIMLIEDDVLSQLARRRMRQLKYSSSAKDVSQAEKEMVKRAEELARTATLVDVYRQNECEYVRARNPFLVYEDRKCVLLSEIPLISDSEYQSFFRDHLTALEDVEANTQRISELEDALRARADELALSECEKDSQLTRYSFLTPYSVPGWADALLRDTEFQQLRDRYDELSRDPVKNADALRELEDAMDARGRAVAEALHTAERNSAQEQARVRVRFPMCAEPPVSVESDSELLRLLKRRSSLKGDILEYSKNIASIDKNVPRRASLLNLSVEETAIEFCQESEVVTFEVRMKRNAGRHRRARIPGGANRKRAFGARSSFSTEVGEFEVVRIGVLEEGANGVTSELSASAQVSRDNKLVGSEESRERNTILQEEEQHRVELGLNDVPQPESASREEMLREQEEATNTNLLPLLTNQEEANRNAFDTEYEISKTDTMKEITTEELSSTQAQEGTTTIAPLFDQESSGRAELLRTEEEERETLGAEYLKHEDSSSGQFVELGEDQAAEELLYPLSASEANQLRGEAEKEMRKQKDTLYNEELEERDTMYGSAMEQGGKVHDLASTEGVSSDPSASLKELLNKEEHERNTIMTIEEGDRIALEFMRLTDAEILLRKETEKEAEDTVKKEAISLKESRELLDKLSESLLSTEKTEEERSKLLDDEARARDQLVLEADEEEIALRQQRKMADDLRFLIDEEVMSRDVTICEEDEDWKRMEWQFHTFFGLLVSLAKLANSEEELRSSIRSTEESEFNALKEKGDDDSVEALRAQEEREAVEEEIRQAKRKHDAGMSIKSVVFAYRTRRRLDNHFFNRKAQECENAFGDTFCMEFNARSAISGEEKAERQQIDEAKRSLLSRTRKPSIKTFAELEKEEDDVRNHLIDDCMFHLSQLQRASRKAVARQNEFIPSPKNLQEFEENEDRAKGRGMPSTAKARFNLPLSDPSDAEEEEGDDDEECEEEEEDDYNAPLKSGKYKGYALDPIGSFLLQYERDLRRFKASLEKNRMSVAAEHDLLKKTRDNATQDMVHGGTGALWVPTRPLPLSDLVRGPSAQYRRGRIVDARGQRPSSRMTDADGRVVTPSGAPSFGGFMKEGNSF